jgi:hypothetical protein
MKLLDFPDLKSYYNMTNSGIEDIERQIELMVDKHEYQSPEPFQNLQYGVKKMQQAYLLYKSQGAPEDLLEMFRQWMSDANDIIVSSQQPPQAPQPPTPATQPVEGAAGPDSSGLGSETPVETGKPGVKPTAELLPNK